jgi:WD40 repeat protein
MSATRRSTFIALTLFATFLSAGTFASANELDHPYRILQLEPAGEQDPLSVVTAVAIQPGRRLVATSGDDHRVRIWELSTGKLVREFDGHADWVHSAAFSPDGRLLTTAGADGKILVCDCGDSRHVEAWKQTIFARQDAAIARVVFSPDGTKLAVAGFNSGLNVYDVSSRRRELSLGCPCDDMRAVAISPRGDLLAGGGRNGHIRLWSLETGEAIRDVQAHRQRIRSLAFTADQSRILSTGEDCTVRVWSVNDGQLVRNLPRHPCKVLAMTMCGSQLLATAGSDNHIRIWDLDSGSIIGILTGHTGSVAALDFSRELLMSGSYDTTARIWNLNRIEKSAGLKRSAHQR